MNRSRLWPKATRLLACAFALAVSLTALPARQAMAEVPTSRIPLTDREPSLATDVEKLSGSDWMSGLSGQLYLHEINLPGTHDSSMWNPYAYQNLPGAFKGYAKTQGDDHDFKWQLSKGVRLFDLRLTHCFGNTSGQRKTNADGLQGLFFVHGKFTGFRDFRYYARYGDEKHLQFAPALTWFTDFLKDHPTETVILDISCESDAGDNPTTLRKTREALDPYYTKVNPSTGRPYIYTQDGNKTVTTMPQLSECRGQLVIISSDDLQRGVRYVSTGKETPTSICGIGYYNQNDWEATLNSKIDQINSYLKKTNENVKMPLDMNTEPNTQGGRLFTTSNRDLYNFFTTSHKPAYFAENINPRVYDIYAQTRGRFMGWVYSDFVSETNVKVLWKTNFPEARKLVTLTYQSKAESGATTTLKQVTLVKGSQVKLPSQPGGAGTTTYAGWNTTDNFFYSAGQTFTVDTDTTLTAEEQNTWTGLQRKINETSSGDTITLDHDVTALKSDKALTIENKAITIDLNGHTINRNNVSGGDAGGAIIVSGDSELTLKGGTLTGGSARVGGGVWVKGETGRLTLENMKVEGNVASKEGGAVMLEGGCTLRVKGGSISNNRAGVGGGVSVAANATGINTSIFIGGSAQLTGNTTTDKSKASNVYLHGGGSNMPLVQLTGADAAARVGISTETTLTAGKPLQVTQFLPATGNDIVSADDATQTVALLAVGERNEAHLAGQITVTFNANGGAFPGGSRTDSTTCAYGAQYTQPSRNPVWAGMTFGRWYTDPACKQMFDPRQSLTSNITLYASWVPDKCTVYFDANGGTGGPGNASVNFGSRVDKPTSNPTREGYDFKYWAIDRSGSFGGASFTRATQEWVPYDFNAMVTKNVVLFAQWAPSRPSVTFDANGGSFGDGSATTTVAVDYGTAAAAPAANPTQAGAAFGGWFDDAECLDAHDFAAPVRKDQTVYAKWVDDVDPETFSVVFDTQGGTAVETQQVAEGGKATRDDAGVTKTTREHYTFDGWYADAALTQVFDFDAPITSDVCVRARWTPEQHTVRFTNSGSAIEPKTVDYGQLVAEPNPAPTADEADFEGWFIETGFEGTLDDLREIVDENPAYAEYIWIDGDGEGAVVRIPFDFEEPVTEDTTLVARWSPKQYTVSFDANGVVATDMPSDQTGIESGTAATAPTTDPRCERKLFAGWYLNPECTLPYSFNEPVTSNVKLWAKWVPKLYDVTFVYGGDMDSLVQSVVEGGVATRPDNPAREDYTFDGWFANAELTTSFEFTTPIMEDTVIYAKWTPVVKDAFVVSFDAKGGTPEPDFQMVDAGENATKPADPTRERHTFAGWYETVQTGLTDEDVHDYEAIMETWPELAEGLWIEDGTLFSAYDFDAPVTADVRLTARWTPDAHTVTVVANDTEIDRLTVLDGDVVDESQLIWHAGDVSEGDEFTGWFADEGLETPFDFTRGVTADTEIFGAWEEIEHDVTFDSEGGSAVEPATQKVADGERAKTPAVPTKPGSTFLGWYQEVGDTSVIDDIDDYFDKAAETAETDEERETVERARKAAKDSLWIDGDTVYEPFDPESNDIFSDVVLRARWHEGTLTCEVALGEGAPKVEAPNLREVAVLEVTDDEIARDALVRLSVEAPDEDGVDTADRDALAARVSEFGGTAATWLDLSLAKRVGGEGAESVAISQTQLPLELSVEVPEALRNNDANVVRTFYLLRAHDGEVDVVASGTGDTLSGTTDRFSTYLLAYHDGTLDRMAPTGNAAGLPKTGDATPLGMVVALIVAAIALVAMGTGLRRWRRQH